jgi:peptidoglycan/LPS O-acetylase OafA/YrhL
MDQSKLAYVDVLRGFAILGVVFLHFTSLSGVEAWLPQSVQFVVEQGGHGVQLFFIASAFTLFRSFSHRSQFEQNASRNFFIRRYFRIAPMYYVGICYYLWQTGFGPTQFLDGTFQNTPLNILSNVFFVQEFNPYFMWLVPGSWSIAAEMMFYLMVPLLIRWIPNMRAALRFLGISLLIRVISWYGFTHLTLVPDPMIRNLYASWVLPTQLSIFALGIVLYFILRGDAWPKLNGGEWLAGASIFYAEVFTQGGRVFQLEFVLGLAFVCMAVAFSKLDWGHWLGKMLQHIGKVSFSMYVVHWAVVHWLDHFGLIQINMGMGTAEILIGYAWRFALMMGATVLISTATYQWVEKPGQRLGTLLIDRLNKKPKAAA